MGGRVRSLRRKAGVSQADLASRVGVSPAYLNLIENNKRPLTANVLIRLCEVLNVEVSAFTASEDARLVAELTEAFGDPLFEESELTNVDLREMAQSTPNVARATLALYRAYRESRETVNALASREHERSGEGFGAAVEPLALPTEQVSDFIERHQNYFPTLEAAAEALWRDARIEPDDIQGGLMRHLAKKGISVRIVRVADERHAMRRYDADRRILHISEVLPPRSRRFQIAHQVCLLLLSAELDDIVTRDRELTTSEARSLCRVVLANYFASALLMPYEPFFDAARAERYDIELLAHRFGASFEQVCHRLTTLRRPGREGVPFHFLRIDVAGNISKRFSASGIRIARFSGACPRWNVHAAFLTPGMIRIQISRMPDGNVYFCIARTIRSDRGGYNVPHSVHAIGMGCHIRYARELVYSEGVDLEHEDAIVPVGVTCRTCDYLDCAQRAFPPLIHPLRIREHVRGVSFYAPVEDEDFHARPTSLEAPGAGNKARKKM